MPGLSSSKFNLKQEDQFYDQMCHQLIHLIINNENEMKEENTSRKENNLTTKNHTSSSSSLKSRLENENERFDEIYGRWIGISDFDDDTLEQKEQDPFFIFDASNCWKNLFKRRLLLKSHFHI